MATSQTDWILSIIAIFFMIACAIGLYWDSLGIPSFWKGSSKEFDEEASDLWKKIGLPSAEAAITMKETDAGSSTSAGVSIGVTTV